jgi:hypothetical protein
MADFSKDAVPELAEAVLAPTSMPPAAALPIAGATVAALADRCLVRDVGRHAYFCALLRHGLLCPTST